METFLFSLNAVAPIVLVILFGYFLKRSKLLSDNFFKESNKFIFNATMPIYLFCCVYSIDSLADLEWGVIFIAIFAVLLIFFAAILFFSIYTKDIGKKGALIQCAYRSNYAIIGFPLAKAMGGDSAMAVAAVISAIGIPTFNILAVITLSIFSYDNENKHISVKEILISIYKNPLIRGVVVGLIFVFCRNFTDFRIQKNLPFLYESLENIGNVASTLALIVLGGQFEVSAVKSLAKDISLGVIWRLIITPVVGLGLALLVSYYNIININATAYPALIAFFGSPVAVSSAIMAEAMNAHGELSRQLVMWTNCVSVVTVFVIIMIFKGLGLLA